MALLLLFIIVPIVELVVIGQVSDAIGLGWTLVILFGDSLLGAVLVKREGRRAWDAFRRALNEARWPGDEVAQGALVLVGGALLLTPGFVTDVVGLLAVLAPTRRLISAGLRARMRPGGVGDLRGRAGSRREGQGSAGSILNVEVVSVESDDEAADTQERERLDPGVGDDRDGDGRAE